MSYLDPIIQKYTDLLKANCPKIKKYYQGEPYKVAASNLPAVFISKTSTAVGPHSNAEDEHECEFRLTLVTDIRDDLSTSEENVVAGIASLYEIMEGRNSSYVLNDDSILDVLRSNINVDTSNNLRTDLGSITRVEYSELNNRDASWFIESHISFIGNFTQTR